MSLQTSRARRDCTYGKKDEVFLIGLPHAIVHPRAVMIHFSNAALADTAEKGTVSFKGPDGFEKEATKYQHDRKEEVL